MQQSDQAISSSREFLSRTVVVIPALNEVLCVAATVKYWLDHGANLVRVVDNGSTDDTAASARDAGAEVLNEPVRGYGAAAWTGTLDLPANIEWILFSSADGSDRLDATETEAFQRAINHGVDLVLGERVSRPESRLRLTPTQQWGNALCCWLIDLGWGHRFRDMASLRVVHRRAFSEMRLADRAFGWNVEMQVRALEQELRIVEVPVQFHPRAAGESKISGNLSGIFRAGWGILSMVGKLHAGRSVRRTWKQHPTSAGVTEAVR